jgi:hypothetical protein
MYAIGARAGYVLSADHLVLVVALREIPEGGLVVAAPAPARVAVAAAAAEAEREVQRRLLGDAVVGERSAVPRL